MLFLKKEIVVKKQKVMRITLFIHNIRKNCSVYVCWSRHVTSRLSSCHFSAMSMVESPTCPTFLGLVKTLKIIPGILQDMSTILTTTWYFHTKLAMTYEWDVRMCSLIWILPLDLRRRKSYMPYDESRLFA
jgi:hypothetical protein